MLSVVALTVVTLRVAIKTVMQCHFDRCHYAKCHGAVCIQALIRYSQKYFENYSKYIVGFNFCAIRPLKNKLYSFLPMVDDAYLV
jgi:hypothetical protein